MAAAKLDALIIIGDDQNEQYSDDNMPAILIYRGETIINNPLYDGRGRARVLAPRALAIPCCRTSRRNIPSRTSLPRI